MKKRFKALAARLARARMVRSIVGNLIYPTIVDCLHAEIRPDVPSPSGVAEALAWKAHAYLVLAEELRQTGMDCSGDKLRHDKETRTRVIEAVLRHSSATQGDVLEFGVSTGDSLRIFAERCLDRHVYGFDSFEGIPTTWWIRPKGTFKADRPKIDRPNVTLIEGLFDRSIPRFLGQWNGQVAIVHVDCDLYSSTIDCLLPLLPRCQVGTVILFDEYYNYPDFAQHEWLAWGWIRARYGMTAPCIAYDGRRAAFQITDLG